MLLDEVLRQAQVLGFFGPGDLRRHQEHAQAFVGLVVAELGPDPPRRFLDLGSGGGLPGLALAEALPETPGTLLDSQQRRTAFLEHAVAQLGWGRIEVVNGRAEDVARAPAHRGQYDLVVARSFAAPAVTAECAAGFLRPGGRLIVSEPPIQGDEGAPGRWESGGLADLGFDPPTPVLASRAGATVAILRLPLRVADRWPRRPGIPNKRPLWVSPPRST